MEQRSIHSLLPTDLWIATANEANRWGLPRGKVAGQLILLGLETLREREAAGDPIRLDDLVAVNSPRRGVLVCA